MIPERINNHVEQGLARLLRQFKDKPRIRGWAKSYLKQCQLLEDAIYDVMIYRMIDNAVGEQLNVIGRIVGEPRGNNTVDADYKVFLRARVRINRSQGTTGDVLAVLAIVSKTPVYFAEFAPACLFIESLSVPDRDPVVIYTALHATKAAGVKLTYVVPTSETKALVPMSVGESNDFDHAVGDAGVTQAFITSGNGPFALAAGHVLSLRVGGVTFSYTFVARDVLAPVGAVSLAEIINREFRRSGGFARVSGAAVQWVQYRPGSQYGVAALPTTANAIIGFPTTLALGTGDTSKGLAADAVTIRNPLALT
jgi:hypothetical protein